MPGSRTIPISTPTECVRQQPILGDGTNVGEARRFDGLHLWKRLVS